MLDKAGFTDAKIVVSNSLDEYTITSILSQGGCIDSFGVGERMITAKTVLFLALFIRSAQLRKMVNLHRELRFLRQLKRSLIRD